MVGKRDPKNDPEIQFLALEFGAFSNLVLRFTGCQQILRETELDWLEVRRVGLRSKAYFSF